MLKIREVAYAGIISPRRRMLHRRTADVLENAHADDLDAVRAQIAAHLEGSGQTVAAIAAYHRAAEAAKNLHASEEAIRLFHSESPDLVLLDLMLPKKSGFEVLDHIRKISKVPVILLTARGQETDKVRGRRGGADDYVSKPFDLRELLARVRSVLRRSGEPSALHADTRGERIRFGGFMLDRAARQLAMVDGTPVHLTTGEYELLLVFIESPNRVLSRDDLIGRLHGRDAGPFDRSVDMQVGRLRRKIEADPAQPAIIKSVRGAGYVFAARTERT
jgi:two-component system OmpR family response regulator